MTSPQRGSVQELVCIVRLGHRLGVGDRVKHEVAQFLRSKRDVVEPRQAFVLIARADGFDRQAHSLISYNRVESQIPYNTDYRKS